MPYAPGASKTVLVEPPYCTGKTPGTSASTEHALLRDTLRGWLSPTPCQKKKSSAQGRVCSFPSWPEAPIGWGARRGGPGTDMLAPRTRSGETACVEGGSRHESTHPSGQLLQTNRRDGCIERCVSASTYWMGACKGPGSECAGPRLVITHCLSWARWSKGWRTLTSSRPEGLALSRPSSAGPRFLHARPQPKFPCGPHVGFLWAATWALHGQPKWDPYNFVHQLHLGSMWAHDGSIVGSKWGHVDFYYMGPHGSQMGSNNWGQGGPHTEPLWGPNGWPHWTHK